MIWPSFSLPRVHCRYDPYPLRELPMKRYIAYAILASLYSLTQAAPNPPATAALPHKHAAQEVQNVTLQANRMEKIEST